MAQRMPVRFQSSEWLHGAHAALHANCFKGASAQSLQARIAFFLSIRVCDIVSAKVGDFGVGVSFPVVRETAQNGWSAP